MFNQNKINDMRVSLTCVTKGLLAVALLLLGQMAYAQRTVTGTVTDAGTGEPLIGANVLVVGTVSGTITEVDGTYSVNVPAGATELQFSYTGYQAQTVAIGDRSAIDVQLVAGEFIEEVLVIGYGTQKKSDKTGAVNAVSAEEFNRGVIFSPDQLITGKVAGVQIVSNSGEPGANSSIRIRGGTSINASNEPLYVIDGVPIENVAHNPGGLSGGRNPLNAINPSDIETFTVLKDASAGAIYGSRAANGVIIITTKKGSSKDNGRVTYDGGISIAQEIERPEVFSGPEYRAIVEERFPNKLNLLANEDTDWYDQIVQTGFGHNHAVSFSGGANNTGYRISLGYLNQDGIIKTSNTERISFGMNFNTRLLNDKLGIDANIKGANTNDQFAPGVVGSALQMAPTQPLLDPGNEWGGYWEWDNDLGTKNPLAELENVQEFGKAFRSIGNIQFDYQLPFLSGLSAKLNLGYDLNKGDRKRFLPSFLRSQYTDNGEIRIENYTVNSQLLEFFLNYNRQFGATRLEVLAGYSYQDFQKEYPNFRAWDLQTDLLGLNSTAPAVNSQAFTSVINNRLISFFGRANLNISEKYILTATLRRDGSSRFGGDNRWGIFPSAAFAWRILEEGFMDGLTGVFSDLKLRLGWGINGNQEIGDYRYVPQYVFGDPFVQYQFGDQFVTTVRPDAVDPNLKWEETSSYNAGLDFGFLSGRINGSIDYYYKRTNDLLFEVTVPAGSNLSNIVLTNIGEVENQGVELILNGFVVSTDKVSWNVGFNAARNTNKILALDNVNDPDFQGYLTGGISGGVGNNIQILRVGSPVNSFYVFEHIIGDDGKPLVDGVDHNEDGVTDLADMYVDFNEDGEVDDLDKRPFENPAPDWLLGLTSTLYLGNLDLAFTLRSALGNYVYNNNASEGAYYNKINLVVPNNMLTSVEETNFTRPQYFSDYYVENGSFLRLDNITLGYSFNDFYKNSDLRLYATGQNLFLLSGYSGLDPEAGIRGIDNNLFPRARTFVFGLNLTL